MSIDSVFFTLPFRLVLSLTNLCFCPSSFHSLPLKSCVLFFMMTPPSPSQRTLQIPRPIKTEEKVDGALEIFRSEKRERHRYAPLSILKSK
ncbi:hypothetical protein DVH24_001513 [Malus domestica]|uniref:Uncharacterized protein n=1 Tax=Malus domestica TaxID=3750 RepID=A0A498JZE0_MALDO|nr:hypothetical protein DVH24_001513 [Malus domestica]